ncbi:hypothetical protein BpHYR1_013082 [Brachionus plicatilis]|uniref:Uncharacterized protein n=1 Tax=Brachionus plicatilis TaxID=10195 RepID=A0A3M7PQ89_BRAPC|nr:hypothetical protein BpHYR1_013082 [Brachionus plicatilis]
MTKKSTGPKLSIVKAVTSNQEKFSEITKNGFIRIGHTQIRVSQWKFEAKPTQCFNCQALAHKT